MSKLFFMIFVQGALRFVNLPLSVPFSLRQDGIGPLPDIFASDLLSFQALRFRAKLGIPKRLSFMV